MNLILHIGTHKTASTSLQHFCTLNHDRLKEQGYLYPRNRDSAYAANFLASQLINGRKKDVAAYMESARKQAEKAACHTVVISGESFYAMTAFFFNIHGRPCADYWRNETDLIRQMKECCAAFDNIRIVCYLRPQDEYAGSLYNQLVKNTIGISESFEKFVDTAHTIFDYDSHLKLWEDQFGQHQIALKDFHALNQNIEEDFCRSFLNEACYTNARKKNLHANERLSRDVLETKRIYNKVLPDRALGFIAARTFRSLSLMENDSPGYQIFAPRAFRVKFFSAFTEGNKNIAHRYGINIIPALTDEREETYPGLTSETQQVIMDKFNAIMNRPVYKIELFLRRLVQKAIRKTQLLNVILSPLRQLQRMLRLRLTGW
ncbi:MAG: hypothetical protein ACXW30_00105 [Micavibrio sp.]